MKEYYKVLMIRGEICSIIPRRLESITSVISKVEYKKNEWIRPNKGCGPLCVFNDQELARKFLSYYFSGERSAIRVFKCKIKKSKASKIWGTNAINKKSIRPLMELPAGTVLARQVMLTEEVFDV